MVPTPPPNPSPSQNPNPNTKANPNPTPDANANPVPNANPSSRALTLAEIFLPLTQDGRVGSRHISTYLALLQCQERFLRTYAAGHGQQRASAPAQAHGQAPAQSAPTARLGPFYIHRDEIMRLAKIQGRNTYYRTMSELDAWGYIEYWPSRRSNGATKVFLPLP